MTLTLVFYSMIIEGFLIMEVQHIEFTITNYRIDYRLCIVS